MFLSSINEELEKNTNKLYENDPMENRTLGLTHLPDVSTVSRCLSRWTKSVNKLLEVISDGVLNWLTSFSV